MSIGRMRHRLQVNERTLVDDGAGGKTESWDDWGSGNIWGQVLPLSGSERIEAQSLDRPISHRVKVRYRTDLPDPAQFIHETRTLKQVGPRINENEADRFWIYDCEEV